MKALLVPVCLALLGNLGGTQDVAAQGLVISNARILAGRDGAIERGSVVVRDGKIVSVSAGAAAFPGARVIDAKGMTVMPGFIDAHRHLIQGDPAQWLKEQATPRMREFLDAGFTTVFSAGDSLQEVLELRRRLARGEIKGPRLLVSGRAPLARAPGGGVTPSVDPARSDRSRPPLPPTQPAAPIPPEETRATVEALAKAGVDAVKTVIIVTPGGPEKETLALVVKEAKRHGIPTEGHRHDPDAQRRRYARKLIKGGEVVVDKR